jgi:alpha-glucosidase
MHPKRLAALSVLLLSLLPLSGCQSAFEAPSDTVSAHVYTTTDGHLVYHIKRNGTTIVKESSLGITVDGVDLGNNVKLGPAVVTKVDETYQTRGVHSVAVNTYTSAVVPVTHLPSKTRYRVETRTFNDGFAYHIIVPGQGQHTVHHETIHWNLPEGSMIWYQPNTENYEDIYRKERLEEIQKDTNLALPVTIELVDGTYAAITEAAVFHYSGSSLRATGQNTLIGTFLDDAAGFQIKGTITTPWRVTMTGPTLNDLVNSDIVSNLCPAPDTQLFPNGMQTEWIQPGRSLWHWFSTENPSYEEHKQWVDAAAQMGFEYYLVDESWGHWKNEDQDKWDLLEAFVDHADQRNVGIWVWKAYPDRNQVPGIFEKQPRMEFFRRCGQIGVKGIKMDFMETESKALIDFYENALQETAELELMVNFHGANKPTGESRTYPNEMTREGVRGLEWNKWSDLPAHHYASLPFTRFLAGHGDFTPCTLDPALLKGTTVSLQLANAIVYTSPVLHWADRPELYLESPALDIIKRIPSTWDETLVLKNSQIGELAAFARRKGNDWFVGIINGGKQTEYSLDLAFLGEGPYQSVTVSDTIGTPAGMNVENRTFERTDTITVKMDAGGGFVATFHQ